jgi:RNA recognition motif-containing protein
MLPGTALSGIPIQRSDEYHLMSFTVFLGNLPIWVTADDIKSWLAAESLVADSIKVIRNPETQESKGFAFVEAPNAEEMQAIIRRFDRAPLEDRLLRANPAQPPRGRVALRPAPGARPEAGTGHVAGALGDRRTRGGKKHRRGKGQPGGPQSAFAEELAKAL